MRNTPIVLVAVALSAPIVALTEITPATAISVELANKCRDLAIRAHPPPSPPGGKAYAEAERVFFRNCIAKNGQIQDSGEPTTPPVHN